MPGESKPLARNENLVMSGGNEQRSVHTGCWRLEEGILQGTVSPYFGLQVKYSS